MKTHVCFIGFGEAAQSFCSDQGWHAEACGYDIKQENSSLADIKLAEFKSLNITAASNIDQAAKSAEIVLSVVTADQALTAVRDYAQSIKAQTLYIDMNSVSPTTKQAAADIMAGQNVHYVDVAIMAPVNPKRLDVPLLISGEKSDDAERALSEIGFRNIRIVGDQIGQASSIKMLRSVMVKGMEALTAECAMAANKAGVLDEVFSSLGEAWLDKTNYNLDRMMVHGERRAAEMEEVVTTLKSFGVEPLMSTGTVKRQRELGQLGIKSPSDSLVSKLDALTTKLKVAAE